MNAGKRLKIKMSFNDLVIKGKNRIAVFSNKKGGCCFSQSEGLNTEYWRGWFVRDRKILADYILASGGKFLDRKITVSEIYPHKIVKKLPGIVIEEIFADEQDVLILRITGRQKISIAPVFPVETGIQQTAGEKYALFKMSSGYLALASKRLFGPAEYLPGAMDISAAGLQAFSFFALPPGENVVAFSYSENANDALACSQNAVHGQKEIEERKKNRLKAIIDRAGIMTSDREYEKALNWALIQADNLIMEKEGKGIYAGYPWFTNYWGRDTFISFPGMLLVSGNFPEAKKILFSFWDFQNQNPESPDYGRVPNRVNNKDDIIYNTVDGTPRAIISVYEYIKYSGDTGISSILFPRIEKAIEGMLRRCDGNMFLKHNDADTWMDARIEGKEPITPRGDRANDIQVLWYLALKSGAEIAGISGKENLKTKWETLSEKLKINFLKFFTNGRGTLFDHINSDGTGDAQIRPNQVFAVSMAGNELLDKDTGFRVTKEVTERLTYPYGVSTLNQYDRNFKPVHHTPLYHFDIAYHNGLVWQFLAGPLITSLVKYGYENKAYELTESMTSQILGLGAVGTLAELINPIKVILSQQAKNPIMRCFTAVQHDKQGKYSGKKNNPALSGTFSQAWSIAEFIRVFYQDYAGFRPDMTRKLIELKPAIPEGIKSLSFNAYFGQSSVRISLERKKGCILAEITPLSLKDEFRLEVKLPGKTVTVKKMKNRKYLLKTGKTDIKLSPDYCQEPALNFQKPELSGELNIFPHRSFFDIPFANGLSSFKFNLKKGCIDSFRDHIYSFRNEKEPSINLILGLNFTLICGKMEFKLTDIKPVTAEYINGTGIVKTGYLLRGEKKENIKCEVLFFSPFTLKENSMYALIRCSHRGFSVRPAIQESAGVKLHTANASDDTGFCFAMSMTPVTITGKADELFNKEMKWWKEWHKKTILPAGLEKKEKELFLQSAAVLKMAQCREEGRSYGQVLASLPPGHWNICWIRDAVYALNGLTLSGHFEEAGNLIRFFLNAECGKYKNFTVDGREVGIGRDYRISVCRYYGDGTEESDGGEDPNIELDGFGLFLWALELYSEKSGDYGLFEKYSGIIKEEIGEVLIHSTCKNNIIRRDSSIWERHIRKSDVNLDRYFTYTTVTAIRGLEGLAGLCGKLRDEAGAEKYKNAAGTLLDGFRNNMIDKNTGIIKGYAFEDNPKIYMDASVIEAVNFGYIDGNSSPATFNALDKYLRMKHRNNGYCRSDDGADYDRKEWVVMDLRIASALKKTGNKKKAEALKDWIVRQSSENFNLIAELYTEIEADYDGAVPMCGFGPGALIMYLAGH